MELFGLDKPTITLLLLRLIEWHQHCNISTHLQNLSFIDNLQNIFYASHNQNISKICMWMALDHLFFVPVIFKNCSESASMFVFAQLQICAPELLNCYTHSVVYCNKAAEQHNRPPLKSTNKSLFPWLAPAWLWCGVNIEFPNDGPCRL